MPQLAQHLAADTRGAGVDGAARLDRCLGDGHSAASRSRGFSSV